jgi:hypothetical protein
MASFRLSDPRVVLFGAGASRGGLRNQPIPPPVDGEFFAVANRLTGHGTPKLAKRVLKSVWQLFGKVESIGLEEYYREIETRATIGFIAKSVGKPKDWTTRVEDLEELIRRVYIHTTTREVKGTRVARVSSAHRKIVEALPAGAAVLTFNYDLLIEESFKSGSKWNPRDGFGAHLVGSTFDWARRWLKRRNVLRGTKSEIVLLKLHGSSGWGPYPNGVVKLKARPYYVRTGKTERVSVLPPGYNKRIDRNPYRLFWREARLKLEHCKSLMIVGYSLPETDLLARALFAEVVRIRAGGANYLNELVLVDPNPSVRAKFVKLLTPALGPLAKIVQYEKVESLPAITSA